MNKFNSFHSDHISKFGYSNQSVSVDSVVDLKEFVAGVVGTTTTGGDVSSSITSVAVDNIPVFDGTTGKLLKSSTVSINTAGDIRSVNSIATNSHLNNSGNAGIQMGTGTASDFTFNSDQYKGAGNVGKILSLDTNGKLIPITPPSSGSNSGGIYGDFKVIQFTLSTAYNVYAVKTNKMVSLAFPAITVSLLNSSATINSSVLPANLLPDNSFITPVLVGNTPAYVKLVKSNLQYYLQCTTLPVINWVDGPNIIIQPFTITYSSSNNDTLADGTFPGFADLNAPTLVSLLPALDAPNVSLTSTFTITLNEPVAIGTGNITLKVVGGAALPLINVSTCSVSNNSLIIPAQSMVANTNYCILIDYGALIDVAGNPFAGIYLEATWKFNSADTLGPTATLTPVLDGSYLGTLQIVFNEAIAKFAADITINVFGGAFLQTINTSVCTIAGNTFTIPHNTFTDGVNYEVLIPSGDIKDIYGNSFAGYTTGQWKFIAGNATYLDGTTPTIAFGLTRLLASYTTNKCINVRNGSSTLLDIGFINNAFDVTAFNNHKAAGGGGSCFVTRWYNQTGSNDFWQPPTATQPGISINGGYPQVEFNAANSTVLSNQTFLNGSLSGYNMLNNHTSYVSFSSVSTVSQNLFVGLNGNDFMLRMDNTNITHTHRSIDVTVNEGTLDFNNGTKYFTEHVYDQITGTLTVGNNTTSVTNSAAITGSANDSNFALGYTGNGTYFTGNKNALIIYPTNIGTTNRNTIKQNILL